MAPAMKARGTIVIDWIYIVTVGEKHIYVLCIPDIFYELVPQCVP